LALPWQTVYRPLQAPYSRSCGAFHSLVLAILASRQPCEAWWKRSGREECSFWWYKSAVFVTPFEKDLLTQFHSELVSYILQYTRNVRN
jgi:hypothetical protein